MNMKFNKKWTEFTTIKQPSNLNTLIFINRTKYVYVSAHIELYHNDIVKDLTPLASPSTFDPSQQLSQFYLAHKRNIILPFCIFKCSASNAIWKWNINFSHYLTGSKKADIFTHNASNPRGKKKRLLPYR